MDLNINEDRLKISKDLNLHKFKATPERIEQIEKFNKLTGKKNTLQDLATAYHSDLYKDQPEIRKELEKIGDSLKNEQLQRSSIARESMQEDLER